MAATNAAYFLAATRLKVALTLVLALIVTTQDAIPEQAPVQPENEYLEAGVAVRVTTVVPPV